MKTKVKICGIKTLEVAQSSIIAGAGFLGFNFVPTSKRYIQPEKAKAIIDKLSRSAINVGVFRDEKLEMVNQLIDYLNLDDVQLHGNESLEYVNLIENAGIIKTFSLDADFNIEETINKMKKYNVDYFLLDRKERGRGELLNLDKVRELTSNFPIILAGGLTPENVAEAVRLAKPHVVDVAGGVENDGQKDKNKIIKFIKNAKQYDI
jgi:phosphoribosylanthranilate isomerase